MEEVIEELISLYRQVPQLLPSQAWSRLALLVRDEQLPIGEAVRCESKESDRN